MGEPVLETSPKTGIFDGIPADDYHSHEKFPFISSTGLKLIRRSPQHYLASIQEPKEPSDAMIFGSIVHTAILEPAEFSKNFVGAPDFGDRRKKENKAAYEQFVAENTGKKVLPLEDYRTVERLVESVYAHKEASRLLTGGKAEQTLIWEDPEEKVMCKARPDMVRSDGIVVDVKTTMDASSRKFSNDAINHGYHIQSAFYTDALKHLTGKGFDTYIIVAVEKEPPFEVALYVFSDVVINEGRRSYREALQTYAKCLRTNYWPGYSREIQTILAPGWM